MNKNIKFSIVIPLYNKVNHIQRAIDSVLNQTIQDFELIVVNDGSTDGSEKVVEKYNDNRIKLINKKNGGESLARNRGIEEANAEYIAFLDADDEWSKYFLKMIFNMIEKYPNIGGFATEITNKKEIFYRTKNLAINNNIRIEIIDNYFKYLNKGVFPVSSSSVCIRKDVFKKVGKFNENLIIGPDIDMWIRVFLHSGIVKSDAVYAIYYLDSDNRSIERQDFTEQELKFFLHLKENYLNRTLNNKYYIELKKWISMRIYQIVIRLIYKNQKKMAFKIYLNNIVSLTLFQSFYILFRLITPNILIERLKTSILLNKKIKDKNDITRK